MTATTTATATETGRIDAARLRALLEQGDAPTIIDVRTPAEHETAHIPGAVSVPVDLLGSHRDRIASVVEEGAVLVCQTGPRADQAREHLAAAGRTGVQVLDGGMNTWESAGAPVTRGRETWSMERQVRLAAGSIVLAGVVGSLAAPRLKFLSGAIGGGLVYSALSNTCGMGNVLGRMPWNQGARAPHVDGVVAVLDR